MSGQSPSQLLAIVGSGVMGINIAATAVGHGIDAIIFDTDESALQSAPSRLNTALRHGQLMAAFPAKQNIGGTCFVDSSHALADATAVIEAVTENLDIKRAVLREISQVVHPDTPLISNTSSIPIDELADELPRPSHLIGVHFMNPTYLIKMVEVVNGARTSERIAEATVRLLGSMDRTAVIVRDSPGFVTSRLLHPMINDAARLVEQWIATPEQIDSLMQGCLGHPTGPLRTADLIGLDNLVDSLNALYARTSDARYKPCDFLFGLVSDGHLGRKSGRGFYVYREGV